MFTKLALQVIARHLSCIEAETQRSQGGKFTDSLLASSSFSTRAATSSKVFSSGLAWAPCCASIDAVVAQLCSWWPTAIGRESLRIRLCLACHRRIRRRFESALGLAWPGAVPMKARSQGSPSARANCYRPAEAAAKQKIQHLLVPPTVSHKTSLSCSPCLLGSARSSLQTLARSSTSALCCSSSKSLANVAKCLVTT